MDMERTRFVYTDEEFGYETVVLRRDEDRNEWYLTVCGEGVFLPDDAARTLAAALDPSHAALVAQRDRLRKAIRQADVDQQWQIHAWFGSGEFAYSGSDDDIVTNSEHLQPGDLGERGAE